MDLINRQEAIDALGEEPEIWTKNDEYAQGLNNQWHYDIAALKAVPPAGSERESAEWVKNDNGTYSCSRCQSWIPKEQRYYARFCLHCGSKMEGRTNE